MASLGLLPVALVLLCSNSLGCDLTQSLLQDFSVLNQMSNFSLVLCLKDKTNFRFPEEVMEGSQLQRADATVIVYEMLQQVFTIFTKNVAPDAWDQTPLKQLLNGLHQQLEQLQSCFEQEREWEVPFLESENLTLALKSYFQGIRQYLQGKEYSHCAWEFVRVEFRRIFLFMNKLTRKLRN